MLLAKINDVIYFSQLQMLLAKTNEDQTTNHKDLYGSEGFEGGVSGSILP